MKYHCPLSNTPCKYGGNKVYNYGFMQGLASFCRHPKQKTFVDRMLLCPKLPIKAAVGKERNR